MDPGKQAESIRVAPALQGEEQIARNFATLLQGLKFSTFGRNKAARAPGQFIQRRQYISNGRPTGWVENFSLRCRHKGQGVRSVVLWYRRQLFSWGDCQVRL